MTLVVRVRTILTGVAGAPLYNNLYFGESAGVVNPAAAHGRAAAFWLALAPVIGTNYATVVQPEVPIINVQSGQIQSVENLAAVAVDNTAAAAILSRATQGLIRLNTSAFFNGRRVRGRIFVPGPTTTSLTAGVPTQGYIDALVAAGQTLLTNSAAPLAVYSRPVPPPEPPATVPPARDGFTTLVTATSAWSEFAVLRSRRD